MIVKGSRFTFWGSGGGALFAEPCFCVRNRPQPSSSNHCGRKVAMSAGEAVKSRRFQGVTRSYEVVLVCGRPGTL